MGKHTHPFALLADEDHGTGTRTTITQWGLQLPNGEISWDHYLGHRFDTEQDRNRMLEVLKVSAQNCGFDEDEFLLRYTWATRNVTTIVMGIGTLPIASVDAIGGSGGGETDDNSNMPSEDRDGGTVLPGSVGGFA